MNGISSGHAGELPHQHEEMQSVVKVCCDSSWESVRELSEYLTRYVDRRLTKTPAARARIVISELLDTAAAAARANSMIDYELLLRRGSLAEFATSVSINMVADRAKLLGTRVHKLSLLPPEEACRNVLAAVAHGKEDETALPLARIRSEGMRLIYVQTDEHAKITASSR